MHLMLVEEFQWDQLPEASIVVSSEFSESAWKRLFA